MAGSQGENPVAGARRRADRQGRPCRGDGPDTRHGRNTGLFRRPPVSVKSIWLRIPRRPRGTGTHPGCHARHDRNRSTCVSGRGWHPSGWARVGGRQGSRPQRSRLKPEKPGAARYASLWAVCTSPARCLRIRELGREACLRRRQAHTVGWRLRPGRGPRPSACVRAAQRSGFFLPVRCRLALGRGRAPMLCRTDTEASGRAGRSASMSLRNRQRRCAEAAWAQAAGAPWHGRWEIERSWR